MTRKTINAMLFAIAYTGVIAIGGVYFINHIWPILPGWMKLIGFILLAFFALGPPYIWLVKRSDQVMKEFQSNKKGPPDKP